jgi:hypothetical protein
MTGSRSCCTRRRASWCRLQCFFQLPFRQRERAEPAEVHALSPEIFHLRNLQGGFVSLPRIVVLAACTERISELGAQRGPQPLHPVARREATDDVDPFPRVPRRQVEPAPDVEASTQPSENHGSAVARHIAEPGENRLEHRNRQVDLPLVEQLLAALSFGDIPCVGDIDARLRPRTRRRGVHLPRRRRARAFFVFVTFHGPVSPAALVGRPL